MHLIQSLETHFTWLYSLSIYVVWYLIKLDIVMVLTLQCRCGVNSTCCSGWKSFKSDYSKMHWSSMSSTARRDWRYEALEQYGTQTGGMRHWSSTVHGDGRYETLEQYGTQRLAVWDTGAVRYTETGGMRHWSSTVHRDWRYEALEQYEMQRLAVWGTLAVQDAETGGMRHWSSTVHRDWRYEVLKIGYCMDIGTEGLKRKSW